MEAYPWFSHSTETMLLIAVRYATFCNVCIKQAGLLDFVFQDKLDGVFSSLSGVLADAHAVRGFVVSASW